MHYYKEHGIVPEAPTYNYNKLDTLHIKYAVTFGQISAVIGLPVDQIRMLNPVYKLDFIPEGKPWSVLVLPADKVGIYLRQEINIQGYNIVRPDYNLMVRESVNTAGKKRVIHVVQPGETTHKIAIQYHCTLENIKIWNNLDGFEVKAGQEVVIWVTGEKE
jgi:membrane-bound lytic murein transglycosylase D